MEPQDLPHGPEDTAGPADPLAGPLADPALDPHGAGPSLLLAGVEGPQVLGPATIDSDADGLADTALAPPRAGDALVLATDLDGDGDVDVLTTVGADGSARTGTVPAPGGETGWDDGWDDGWDAPAPPAATLDPATGAWTRAT